MLNRLIFALSVSFAVATHAGAQDIQQGWGFQFRQDTFDKITFPLAMMAEDGDGYSRASLYISCSEDGALAVAYTSGSISLAETMRMEIKAGEATQTFTFSTGDFPRVGRLLSLSEGEVGAFLSVFEKAQGIPVPFRTADHRGTFSSIGAERTFRLMRENCPK